MKSVVLFKSEPYLADVRDGAQIFCGACFVKKRLCPYPDLTKTLVCGGAVTREACAQVWISENRCAVILQLKLIHRTWFTIYVRKRLFLIKIMKKGKVHNTDVTATFNNSSI
jgi:hypothetical protein